MPRYNRRRRRLRRAPPRPRRGARGPRGGRGPRGVRGIAGLLGGAGSTGPAGLSVTGKQGLAGIQGPAGNLEVNSGVNLTDPQFGLESLANVQNSVPPTNGELLTFENGEWKCSFWKAARDIYSQCIDSVVNILQVNNGSIGSGSGFFISDDGLILTAAHVILADANSPPYPVAQELFVHVSPDNQSYSATVIGFDRMYDVAIIKVPVTGHSFLELEDSRDAKPGDMIITMGQPGGIHVQSVTMGVIRDTKWADRSDIPESVVSDFDTMGGNSGGAVINAKSKVVGILSWGLTYNEFSLSGAKSSYVCQPIVNHIITNYRNNQAGVPYKYPGKYLGISYDPVSLYELRRLQKLDLKIEGYLVKSSQTNEISTGTIITKVNGQTVGQNNNQVPLGTLIHLSTSDTLQITIRSPSNNYNTEQNIVVNLSSVPGSQDTLFNAFQIHRKKL